VFMRRLNGWFTNLWIAIIRSLPRWDG